MIYVIKLINFIGIKKQNFIKLVAVTRFNKLFLNENACSKFNTIFEGKLQIKNAASGYQFVNLFNSSGFQSLINNYIERFFYNFK